jgi:hypothetical protein
MIAGGLLVEGTITQNLTARSKKRGVRLCLFAEKMKSKNMAACRETKSEHLAAI